jgi:hypothetical protein
MTIRLSRRAIGAFTRVFDALWRTTFVIGANVRRHNTITSSAKPVRSKEGQGWGLPFDLPLRGFAVS